MRKLALIVLLLAAVLHPGYSWGQTAATGATASGASTADLGLNADNVKLSGKDKTDVDKYSVATQRAVRILSQDWAFFGLSKVINYVGDLCIRILFYLYDNYVGSFLIYIPDMANQYTYMKPGAPDGQGAVNVANSLLLVSRSIGVFFLITLFVAYVGQGASGLSKIQFTGAHLVRFITVFVLLCTWGPVFSILSQLFTAIGYSFFSACNLHTGHVLDALSNFSITTMNQTSAPSDLTTVSNGSRALLINYTGLIYYTVYFVAIALITVGLIVGFLKFSGGDRTGMTRVTSAILALVAIVSMPFLLNTMVSKGVTSIGNKNGTNYQTFSASNSFQGSARSTLPAVTSGPTQTNSETTTNPAVSLYSQSVANNVANEAEGAGGLFKILMSIWGLFIVVGVLFMKFTQVILLGILFILGPIFIGLAANPITSSISMGALRLFIKLLAYSPVWALALVMLYLIPNINFGIADLGVGSLLTAFAVFAGLQVVSDTKELAGLFANFGGAASGGHISASNPIGIMSGAFLGTAGKVQSAGKMLGMGAKAAAVATPQGAAISAGTKAASMALKGAASGGQGSLSAKSYVTPKNIDNYTNFMNHQPATQNNVDQIGRVLSARSKGHNVTDDDAKAQQLIAIQSRMKSQLGGK